jgi:hypothetical protein
MEQRYFSRPYPSTFYRLYYVGAFNGPSPVFTVTGCQISRPDGVEIDEPARLRWALLEAVGQRQLRGEPKRFRFNDGLIDPIKSPSGRERELAKFRRVQRLSAEAAA